MNLALYATLYAQILTEVIVLSMNLGPRLQTIADYVPAGARLGDIGTDHAYLPIFLYEQGLIDHAVGVDIHQGPFRSAVQAVSARNLGAGIEIRLGDGLSPLKAGEVDVLTIAGMGGNTMLEILAARPDVVDKVTHLILQPQGSEDKVRLRLLKEDWGLWDETLVEEEGRIYTVLVFTREKGRPLAELAGAERDWLASFDETENEAADSLYWKFGPLILAGYFQDPDCSLNYLLDRLIGEQIDQMEKQIKGMQAASRPEVKTKIGAAERRIRCLNAINRTKGCMTRIPKEDGL